MELNRTPKPRHTLSGESFSFAEGFLEAAFHEIEPDDLTQRRAFDRLMPQMYVLRNKGCSIPQITALLNQIGFKFQPSTVRVYYNKALASRMDICQSKMNEQNLLLAEIRKQTKGVDMSMMVDRVEAAMEKQRKQVATKIDAILTGASKPSRNTLPSLLPVNQTGAAAPVQNSAGTAVAPASEVKRAPVRAEMLNAGLTEQQLDHSIKQHDAITTTGGFAANEFKFRCSALPEDVPQVKQRENVPKEVYQHGDMEHIHVPGVMLSLRQRLSSIALEFVNMEDGTRRMETSDEKRWRLLWSKPIPMTPSRTIGSFTVMDHTLFNK